MTIPHKYIYIALATIILGLSLYIIFKKEPYDALLKENKEIMEGVKRNERTIHDLKVERAMRVDTVIKIQNNIKTHEKRYYKEIAYVLSADYRTTDSLYGIYSTRFDSAFYAGQYNP